MDADTWYKYGTCKFTVGSRHDATKALWQAIEQDPNHISARMALYHCEARLPSATVNRQAAAPLRGYFA
jgi:Tfp pilus assembly protein PilF